MKKKERINVIFKLTQNLIFIQEKEGKFCHLIQNKDTLFFIERKSRIHKFNGSSIWKKKKKAFFLFDQQNSFTNLLQK